MDTGHLKMIHSILSNSSKLESLISSSIPYYSEWFWIWLKYNQRRFRIYSLQVQRIQIAIERELARIRAHSHSTMLIGSYRLKRKNSSEPGKLALTQRFRQRFLYIGYISGYISNTLQEEAIMTLWECWRIQKRKVQDEFLFYFDVDF